MAARCVCVAAVLACCLSVAVAMQVGRPLPDALQQLRDGSQRELLLKMEQELPLRHCPRNCSDRGPCVAGTCICPGGYGGDDCSQVISECAHFCSGRGICVKRDDGAAYCQCHNGFKGDDCSEEAEQCPKTCKGEECVKACSSKGVCSRGVCFCDKAWAGFQCNERLGEHAGGPGDISEDQAIRALDGTGATYVIFEIFLQVDQTPKEFSRDSWETMQHVLAESLNRQSDNQVQLVRVLPQATASRATGLALTILVKCAQGEQAGILRTVAGGIPQAVGAHVQKDRLETVTAFQMDVSMPTLSGLLLKGIKAQKVELIASSMETTSTGCPFLCNHHGECINDVCVCDRDWYGDYCYTQDECEAGCVQPMVCVNDTRKCACPAGFEGQMCEIALCDPRDCSGHGTCENGVCKCSAPWNGPRCDIESICAGSPLCSGHGQCSETTIGGQTKLACMCDRDYHGIDCHAHLPCIRNCSNHGLCDRGVCVCDQGFSGQDCSDAIQCPRDCSGHGECVLGSCVCEKGYSSYDCSRKTITCLNACSGVGNCVDNVCVCPPNYHGPDCSVHTVSHSNYSCASNCSGHGRCVAGQCECEVGWTQSDCSQENRPCPNSCSGLGVCQANGTCECMHGRGGEDCSKILPQAMQDKCLHNCSGNGLCMVGSCLCVAGYGGRDCSKVLSRCQRGCSGLGQCTGNNLCMCDAGFSGSYCQSPEQPSYRCQNNCTGHGRCIGDVCRCHDGYSGSDCSVETSCPNNCSGHGLCINGECICRPGYGGSDECDKSENPPIDCSQVLALCPNRCSGHGNCTEEGTCECEAGFSGLDCSTAPLCLYNCSGHGICHDGICECDYGWGSDACNKRLRSCEGTCPPNSVCNDSSCVCVDGWSGDLCTVPPVPVLKCPSSHPLLECSGHGDCNNGTCACYPGWFDESCTLQCPKNCSNTNCDTRGVCVGGSCHCAEGWAGYDCSQAVESALSHVPGAVLSSPNSPLHSFSQTDATGTAHSTSESQDNIGEHISAQTTPATAEPALQTTTQSVEDTQPQRVEAARLASTPRSNCPHDCSGHGQCVLGKCACDVASGFGGPDCSQKIRTCPNMCSGAGWCNMTTGACVCERGFAGVDCSVGLLASMRCAQNCSGLGICHEGHCNCGRETSGKQCNVFCPNGCSGNGVCVHGECMCSLHFHNADCSAFQAPTEIAPTHQTPHKPHIAQPTLDLRSFVRHHKNIDAQTLVQLEGFHGTESNFDDTFEQAMKRAAQGAELQFAAPKRVETDPYEEMLRRAVFEK